MIDDRSSVADLAAAAVDVVRDALGHIEELAQRDEDPKWLDLSRRFAMLVAPIRDYLSGAQMGRDLPVSLALRLEPLLHGLDEAQEAVAEAGLQDHLDALRGLLQRARASSSR